VYAARKPRIDLKEIDAVTGLSDAALARELVDALGLKLTAMLGGVTETRSVRKWIEGTTPPDRRDNLIAALQATRAIVAGSGPAAAQRWFLGCNSHFNFEAPAMVLQATTPEVRTQVVRAAIAFATT
jgi:hypothetical protein